MGEQVWNPFCPSKRPSQLAQECIPVGCVPPAQWPAVSRGGWWCIPRTPPLFATHAPLRHTCPLHHARPSLCHACPPFATHAPNPFAMHAPPTPLPRMPPRATTHTPQEQPRMPPRSNHAHPPKSNHAPPRSNHACPPREQPCMPPLPPGATMHAPWEQPRMPPPVNRMTNRCKNITLPQTSFAGGNNDTLWRWLSWARGRGGYVQNRP